MTKGSCRRRFPFSSSSPLPLSALTYLLRRSFARCLLQSLKSLGAAAISLTSFAQKAKGLPEKAVARAGRSRFCQKQCAKGRHTSTPARTASCKSAPVCRNAGLPGGQTSASLSKHLWLASAGVLSGDLQSKQERSTRFAMLLRLFRHRCPRRWNCRRHCCSTNISARVDRPQGI